MSVPETPGPLANLTSYEGIPGLFLDSGHWHGIPYMASSLLKDGMVVHVHVGRPTQQVIIGTRLWTDQERREYAIRWYVQNGLRDVLEWLGEPVLPERPVTGAEILDGIRRRLI